MVLPGIQALFGFQLVAVFNTRFGDALTVGEQLLHYLAILLVTVSIIVVMAPAAYHRQIDPRRITDRFLVVATRLLLWGLWPLALALGLDIYLIGRVILHSALAGVGGAAVVAWAFGLWFLLPRRDRDWSSSLARRMSQEQGN